MTDSFLVRGVPAMVGTWALRAVLKRDALEKPAPESHLSGIVSAREVA